jgi:hypothetical protein
MFPGIIAGSADYRIFPLNRMDKIFEIHAADLDAPARLRIIESIEASVEERGYDPAEVERIRQLSFTPVPPAREYGFDPAATTELFERPVAAPDFNSPKFARFRGPFKTLARVSFRFFSSLHDKLNQNKIQAFYNAVHEIIALNYRQERLRAQVDGLIRENIQLRSLLAAAGVTRNRLDEAGETRSDLADTLPLTAAPAVLEATNRELALELRELLAAEGGPSSRRPILLLDDHGGYLARQIVQQGFRDLHINVMDTVRYLQLRENLPGVIHGTPDALLAEREESSLAAVLIPDLGRLTIDPDTLPELISRKLAPGGLLFFRMNRGLKAAPFSPLLQCDADLVALRELCTALGFRTLRESLPAGLRDGSFELLVQKLG